MGLSYGVQGFILLVAVSLLGVGQARTIVVGGSEGWRYGFNYPDWTLKNDPFYIKDTLVFKYEAPSNSSRAPHNVYILPDLRSFIKCDLRRAKLVANATQGSGEGYKLVLKQWTPHYFACSERTNSSHCNAGLMKFIAVSWPRWHFCSSLFWSKGGV